eukprot:gene10232-12552_t
MNSTLAHDHCSSLTLNNTKGYLATFTHKEEYDFVIQKEMTKAAGWISGSDLDDTGIWLYSSGPEKNQPMYNNYHDKCYMFCNFGSLEPNLLPNEHYTHTSGTASSYYYWNNNQNHAVITGFICEFGGMEDPIIPTVSTQGGEITITNILGYDINTVSITFNNVYTPSISFQCQPLTKTSDPTVVTCQVPPQSGKYLVEFKDGKGTKPKNILWSFEAPYISSLYPQYTTNSRVTITGKNFGNDKNKILVKVGTFQNITCNDILFFSNNEAISCVLSSNLDPETVKFLPVSIAVDNQYTITYKAPICIVSNYAYSSQYSSNLRVDGQVGHLATVPDVNFFNFLNKTMPLPINVAGKYWMWQPISYNPTTKGFTITQGPRTGQPTSIYSLTRENEATWNETTVLTLELYPLILTNREPTFAGSTLTEYGGSNPRYIDDSPVMVSTKGQDGVLKIDNYGTQLSTIDVTFRGQKIPYSRDFIAGALIAKIPEGYDGPYPISVVVDSRSTSNSKLIDYKAPVINTVSRLPTIGGLVQLDGDSYYKDPSIVTIIIGGKPCSTPTFISAHESIRCSIGAGSGVLSGSIKVGQKSSPFQFSFNNPSVVSVSRIDPVGGRIIIDGNDFYTDPSLITVKLNGNEDCTNVQVTIDHKQISCVAPPGQGSRSVLVKVNTLDSNNDINLVYNPPTISEVKQVQDQILISGTNFNGLNQLTLKIGSVDITSNCPGNGTNLVCSNLPLSVISGDISLTGSSSDPASIRFLLTPYITSIFPVSFSTSGGDVSILGRFFETTAYGQSTQLTIIAEDRNFTETVLVSNEKIVFKLDPGTGLNKNLYLVNGQFRKSNEKSYGYLAPLISGVNQQQQQIQITGVNFGVDKEKVSISIGSLTNVPFLQLDHSLISLVLPTDSKNGEIKVVVDQQTALFSSFKIKPILLSFTQVKVDGDKSIVKGYYLSRSKQNGDSTNLKITFNGVESNCIDTDEGSSNPFTYECGIQAGSGSIFAEATVDQLKSNLVPNYYFGPTIERSSQLVFGVPGTVTITGTNFALPLTSTIGGTTCDQIQLINSTYFTCKFAANIPTTNKQPLEIEVSAGGQSTKSSIFDYLQVKISSYNQIGEQLEIFGKYFGESKDTLTVTLGSVELVILESNDTFIRTDILPISSSSGILKVINGPTPEDTILVDLIPILVNVEPNIIDTIGGLSTLTGRFFEKIGHQGTENLVQVLSGSVVLQSTTINNQTIEVTIPEGTGVNYSIKVLIETKSTETKSYSYSKPCITGLNQESNIIEIFGDNFGKKLEMVKVLLENGQSLNANQVNDTVIVLEVPEELKNGDIYVIVDTQESNKQLLLLTPILHQINPKPSLSGSKITITGSFMSSINYKQVLVPFNVKSSSSSVSSSLENCKNIKDTTPYQIECDYPAGTGRFNITLEYETKLSNEITYNYLEPVVKESTSIYYKESGDITISGENFHQTGLKVMVEDIECTNPKHIVGAGKIVCLYNGQFPPRTDGISLLVTVQVDGLFGSNNVFFYHEEKPCKPACIEGQGTCNTRLSKCECIGNWTGIDCAIDNTINNNGSLPEPGDNGNTTIPGTDFSIAITHIREINPLNQVIKTLRMSNIKWSNKTQVSETELIYTGSWEGETVQFILHLFLFKEETDYEFAGDLLKMPSNSVKYEITISNWVFDESLNTLELIYHSKANKVNTVNCKEVETTSKSEQDESSILYFQIESGGNVLTARFADRMFVDKTIRKSRVKLLNQDDQLYSEVKISDKEFNLLAAMVVPFFKNDCKLDPNFSNLIKTEFTKKNGCSSSTKWKLPVILVCSVVGGVSVAVATGIIVKKKLKYAKSISNLETKMSSIRK